MGIPVVSATLRKVFGTRNERMVKRYLRAADQVNAQTDEVVGLSDQELRARTGEFERRIAEGETAQAILPEVFATAREVMDRAVGIRNIFNADKGFDPATLPDDARALYDLEADPAESRNVIEEHPQVAARLSAELAAWSASIPSQAPPPERDPEQLEMLRALGYVD